MEGTLVLLVFTSVSLQKLLCICSANSTHILTPTQPLIHNHTLLSPAKILEFGFTPANSNRWYLGIWLQKSPTKSIVWVGNRNNPLHNSSSAVLNINNNGDLVLLNQTNHVIWSSSIDRKSWRTRNPIVRQTWNDKILDWVSTFNVIRDICNRYGLCGVYGICNIDEPVVQKCIEGFVQKSSDDWNRADWSGGCRRRTALDCDNGDGFQRFSSVKFPDTAFSWVDKRAQVVRHGGSDEKKRPVAVLASVIVIIGTLLVTFTAWNLWNEDKTMELVDGVMVMEDDSSRCEVLRCIQVGLLCVQQRPDNRPTMPSVVMMLGSDTTNLPQPKQPGFYYDGSYTDETPSSSEKFSYGNKDTISYSGSSNCCISSRSLAFPKLGVAMPSSSECTQWVSIPLKSIWRINFDQHSCKTCVDLS
ncbi:hypothetical protein Scep_013217 [Stephania cephalantha]|uniref:Bulb-type lectin domain-containing protein n=1 Tax=Stephania cephalantha TaxID=152367 RepID=A0AAP0P896_9MAGN